MIKTHFVIFLLLFLLLEESKAQLRNHIIIRDGTGISEIQLEPEYNKTSIPYELDSTMINYYLGYDLCGSKNGYYRGQKLCFYTGIKTIDTSKKAPGTNKPALDITNRNLVIYNGSHQVAAEIKLMDFLPKLFPHLKTNQIQVDHFIQIVFLEDTENDSFVNVLINPTLGGILIYFKVNVYELSQANPKALSHINILRSSLTYPEHFHIFPHENKRDFWVFSQAYDSQRLYLMNDSGIEFKNIFAIRSNEFKNSDLVDILFSPDGSKAYLMFRSKYYTASGDPNNVLFKLFYDGKFELTEFSVDKTIGKLTFHRRLDEFNDFDGKPLYVGESVEYNGQFFDIDVIKSVRSFAYGLEGLGSYAYTHLAAVSSNMQYLYLSETITDSSNKINYFDYHRNLIQFNLQNLTKIKKESIRYMGAKYPGRNTTTLQFADNGKLYSYVYSDNEFILQCLPNPNQYLLDQNLENTDTFTCSYYNGSYLSNFALTYPLQLPRLGNIIEKCDFNQTIQLTGDSTQFKPDKLIIDGISYPAKNTWQVHVNLSAGEHLVKIIAITKFGDTISDNHVIHISDTFSKPKASFSVKDTLGCQWISYAFNNTSQLIHKNRKYSYHWQFGNGLDTFMSFAAMPTAAQGSVSHTYTQNGLYRVSLVANDGYCSDTFTLNQQVNILPAPRPGIALAPSDSGCSPLQVQVSRLWSDPIDSAHWQFGDGNVHSVLVNPATAVHTYNHTLSTQQKYLLKQRLFGSTGCITEDSMIISVLPGFENGYTPILDYASLNPDQSVSVSWHPHAHAAQYQVYKNNAPLALSVNANFTDPDYTAQAAYQVSAINACAQPSPLSNIGKLMLLQGQNQNNQSALLQWTAYEDWSAASGILRYQLEVNQNGIFIPVAETNNRDFTDAEFIQSGQYERCYRVTAVQTANPAIQSHSNTACVGYEAVIFVPNAFSPNEDGLNDVFEPFNIGFKHYTLKIYNRWGEKIAEGRSWDGKIQGVPAPVGLYHFQIEGQTGKSENTFLKGEVMLIK